MHIFDENVLRQIKNLNTEELENYINSRVQMLEANANKDIDSIEPSRKEKNAYFRGFIPRQTEIVANTGAVVAGFLVNDNEIYRILINNIKNSNNIATLGGCLQVIQQSVNEYFGGLALEENEENRRMLYDRIELEYDEFEPYSISEYRNNDTALCTERTAIAQNMLAFLGADSYYLMGYLSKSNVIANMNHAYTCIMEKEYGSGILVDFTNPMIDRETNEMYVFRSNFINQEKINKVLSGNEQEEMSRTESYSYPDKKILETTYCYYSMNELEPSKIKKTKIEEIVTDKKDIKNLVKESLDGLESMKYIIEADENINSKNKNIDDKELQMYK